MNEVSSSDSNLGCLTKKTFCEPVAYLSVAVESIIVMFDQTALKQMSEQLRGLAATGTETPLYIPHVFCFIVLQKPLTSTNTITQYEMKRNFRAFLRICDKSLHYQDISMKRKLIEISVLILI